MSISTKSIAIYLIIATVFSSGMFYVVSAQSASITDDQIGRIRTNCVSVKNTLGQLHANDALLRVNRGQIYESMSTKLMDRFNSRAENNHFNIKDLKTVTQNYSVVLTRFREDYKNYEVQLQSALNVDCPKDPVIFYDAIATARTQRAQVHADVLELHQYIDDYQTDFNAFTTAFYNNNGAIN